MRIISIKITNFKRFTDLTVSGISETAKAVIIVGPNGSGKSSLFDAFLYWYRAQAGFGRLGDDAYYRKDNGIGALPTDVDLVVEDRPQVVRGTLYLRTAYRNDPDFDINGFARPADPTANIRVARAIENDQTVSDNYQRLVYATVNGLYETKNDDKSVGQLRDELIGQIRESMRRVFGDLVLSGIGDPFEHGTFLFDKGLSTNYRYKNLSGGEKAAFDLLLDLHTKKHFFPEAIYCIDEIETHLHTRVQGALLKEILRVVPERSQLWITTHSLGVMRAALELEKLKPGTICVLDFDGVDPDQAHEIKPASIGRVAWEKMLSIALDDLSTRMAPEHVIVCEGSALGSRRRNFDAAIYSQIFSSTTTDVVFISGGSGSEVQVTSAAVGGTLRALLPATSIRALVDRDDRSAKAVDDLRAGGTLVLNQRNLESYLLCEEAIASLVHAAGKPELLNDALGIRTRALQDSVARGNPSDDLKSAAGSIYVELKKLLELKRRGNSTDEFLKDTMAPLITPDMACFADLKSCILDPVLK